MRNIVTTLIVTILTLTFVFGGYYLGNMKHGEHGSHCPFMLINDVVCNMETREHIKIFSNIFISTFFKIINLSILSVLLLIVVKSKDDIDGSRYRIFTKTQTRLGVLRNLIILLFSSGILNPKAP